VSVRQSVFESYGADYRRSAEYELDYLITPELGGTSDARNLWPQPYARTVWNAYVKDELELHLHRLACENDRLRDGATRNRHRPIAAYKRHFNTETPPRLRLLTLTRRWRPAVGAEELGISIQADLADGPALIAMLQAVMNW
jgi:hypothetical protein